MSNTEKSRIAATIEAAEIPSKESRSYIERFLSPHALLSNRKVYLYPEVHALLSRMVKGLDIPGVSIGSYASEIILDHIARHHPVMQSIFKHSTKDLF